jgi:dienelactone hydrolase
VFFLLGIFVLSAQASDIAKEKRWEEQIVPGLVVGEAVKLKADGTEFLALHTVPTVDDSKGAVILLHGMGVHPAWPEVIEPLRMILPDYGWHTLSLQMPILNNEAEEKDYLPLFSEVPLRVQAGVDYLKRQGIRNIVVSGHSTGATMAAYYLVTNKDPVVKAFAILSGGSGIPGDIRANSLANFRKIKDINIVDIRGGNDAEKVISALTLRKKIAPGIYGSRYQNLVIDGANHLYRDREDKLADQLNSYLDKNVTR